MEGTRRHPRPLAQVPHVLLLAVAEFRRRWAFNHPSSKEARAAEAEIKKGQVCSAASLRCTRSWTESPSLYASQTKTFLLAIPMGFLPAMYALSQGHHAERETKYPYLRCAARAPSRPCIAWRTNPVLSSVCRVRAASRPFPWGDEDLFTKGGPWGPNH